MILLRKILTVFAGIITIGFGCWHFFVPKLWNWYSYIDKKAIELVLAIRAVNFFFSLSLVLFGVLNIVFIISKQSNRFSLLTVLSSSVILWLSRCLLQIIFPQGAINPLLQYGMLSVFVLVTLCFSFSLFLTVFILK